MQESKTFFPFEIYKRYAIQIFTIFTQFCPENENFQPLPVVKKTEIVFLSFKYLINHLIATFRRPHKEFLSVSNYIRDIMQIFTIFTHFWPENEHFQPLPVIKKDWKRYFCLFNIPNYLICTCRRPHKEFLTTSKYVSDIMQIFTIFTHFWLDNKHF